LGSMMKGSRDEGVVICEIRVGREWLGYFDSVGEVSMKV
jgi:hypothetical protein